MSVMKNLTLAVAGIAAVAVGVTCGAVAAVALVTFPIVFSVTHLAIDSMQNNCETKSPLDEVVSTVAPRLAAFAWVTFVAIPLMVVPPISAVVFVFAIVAYTWLE